MEQNEIRDIILESMTVSLEAQLRALKKLRGVSEGEEARKSGMSQIDIAFNILSTSAEPLHVSRIIEAAQEKFGVRLERESLVSALVKKVMKGDRFARVGKNTFALNER